MPETPVSYHLGKFPPQNMDWEKLIPLIGPTNAALARYDGLLSAIPNAHILLSPLTTQEAVLSSKIEGTQITMGEVLEFEAGNVSEEMTQPKQDDAEEVLNYRKAMHGCVQELKNRRFSQHLLRSAHHELMKGVRGRDKSPGNYRKEQNWIGPKNCPIEEAGFIPIPPEHLQQGMDRWEQFFNDQTQPDAIVQLALLHLEFEALHPFMDGNGRLGRMIIPLFLYHRKLLQSPDFYISAYFEANREEYQQRLREVSSKDSWTEWSIFFLEGVKEQALENEQKARKILSLYEKTKEKVINLTHSQHAIQAVDYLFTAGIFSTPQFTKNSGIPKPSTARIVKILKNNSIIEPLKPGRGRRPGIYAFGELINIAEGKTVF
jgi:Fic family protein